jgi:hypothetical protein
MAAPASGKIWILSYLQAPMLFVNPGLVVMALTAVDRLDHLAVRLGRSRFHLLHGDRFMAVGAIQAGVDGLG